MISTQDMTYAELEAKYGEATLFKDEAPPKPPVNEPFALPELPSFPNPFGGGAPAAEPVFADEDDEIEAEDTFKLPEVKFPWQ